MLRCAFEQATAAGEQGIATQQHARVIKRDVPQGMARRNARQSQPSTLMRSLSCRSTSAPGSARWPGHRPWRRSALIALHRQQVMVMVGDQDIAEVPLRVLLEPGQYRNSSIASRVDHGATVGMGSCNSQM